MRKEGREKGVKLVYHENLVGQELAGNPKVSVFFDVARGWRRKEETTPR